MHVGHRLSAVMSRLIESKVRGGPDGDGGKRSGPGRGMLQGVRAQLCDGDIVDKKTLAAIQLLCVGRSSHCHLFFVTAVFILTTRTVRG